MSKGNSLFVCTPGSGVHRSSDNGDNWVQINNGLIDVNCYRLAQLGDNIFVGTYYSGVFRSSDNGDNWVQINNGLTGFTVYALLTVGNNIFAGTSSGGVCLSTDNGDNWTAINEGLSSAFILCLETDGIYLYAGTGGGSISRRTLDNILPVEEVSSEIPSEFELGQNYPNPFNPTTKINYTVGANGNSPVQLKVYDVLGNEVTTLVNEQKPAGTYQITFDASVLSSGVYFYRLMAGEFISTKKLILMK
jgi:hypothetical protein